MKQVSFRIVLIIVFSCSIVAPSFAARNKKGVNKLSIPTPVKEQTDIEKLEVELEKIELELEALGKTILKK